MKKCLSVIGCLIVSSLIFPALAQVVPDGSSATQVVPGTGGRIRVNIAAPNSSGVSANRYKNFNVPKHGVELENRVVGARTILNQVTSANPSLLEGTLEVLGAKANLIIANPHGITVNGGRFLNTGALALSTGQISTKNYALAPNFTQENLVSTQSHGRITIGPEGMSGAFTYLELLAKEIEIKGALTNENTDSRAYVRLTAGDSVAEFDSLVTPTSLTETWVSIQKGQVDSSDRVLISIERPGAITASQIQIAVTDQGAGVKHAGSALAQTGNFTLTAEGKIEINGGRVHAQKNVEIKTGRGLKNVADRAKSGRSSDVSANEAVRITAGTEGILNEGSIIQGGMKTTLATTGNVTNQSLSSSLLSVISANNGDLEITADQNVENYSARLLAAKSIKIDAEGDFINQVLTQGALGNVEKRTFQSRPKWYEPWKERKDGWRMEFGKPVIPDVLSYVTAGENVKIEARDGFNTGGEINANGGNVTLQVRDFHQQALQFGSASYEETRRWVLWRDSKGSSNVQTVGGATSAALDVEIHASRQISLTGGSVTALRDLTVRTPELLGSALFNYTFYEGPQGIRELFWGPRRETLSSFVGNDWSARTGTVCLLTDEPIAFEGGVVAGAQGVETPAGLGVAAPSSSGRPFGDRPFGFLGEWLTE